MTKSRDTIQYSPVTIGCVLFLFAAVAAYLYFLNMSVVEVVLRSEYTSQARDIQADIASLESSFIDAQHTIAARIADLEGYNMNTPKIFVSRDEARFVLGAE